jgi:hypothetical protein
LNRLGQAFQSNNCRHILKNYHETFPDLYPITEEGIQEVLNQFGNNAKILKYMLLSHADLRLPDLYSHSIADLLHPSTPQSLDILDKIFTIWSIEFGDIQDLNMDWFILDNPVLERPFIRLGKGHYFSSLLGILPHLLFPMFELLMEETPDLLKQYQKARARHLERKAHDMILKAFPNGKVWRNLYWYDHDQTRYETDLLIIIENALCVIECKSGAYTDTARRGGEKSLKKTIEDLILKPSVQANRLIQYIHSTPSTKTFRTPEEVECVIEPSTIQHFIPIALTMDSLGLIATNCKDLIRSGFLPGRAEDIALSICLTDMEMLFEILDSEVEIVHYLKRRRELEQRINYEGDEADLLAYYLNTGFNLGESEFNPNCFMSLVLMSKELDPFFVGRENGIDLPKPRLDKTTWWQDILTRLAERKPAHWLETAMALLSLSRVEQEVFEKEFTKLKNRVKHGMTTQKYNWVVGKFGTETRPQYVLGFPHRIDNKEERLGMINEIIFSEETDYYPSAVVIAIHVDKDDYPYGTLAFGLERNEDASEIRSTL